MAKYIIRIYTISGSLFLRHLQSTLRAANSFRNNAQAGAMADELRAYFPNLQPGRRAMLQPPPATTSATATTGARPVRRQRRLVCASHDRRRSACIRIRMTALDSPHIVSTSNLNFEALKGKGLGKRVCHSCSNNNNNNHHLCLETEKHIEQTKLTFHEARCYLHIYKNK